MLIKHTANSEN